MIPNKMVRLTDLRILALIFLTSGNSIFAHLISIRQGVLEGTTKVSRNGTLFKSYLGIPFAEPPLGKLRFQPPLRAQPWNGVFNATSPGNVCVQVVSNSIPSETAGFEDCLNLNVYTPADAKPGDNIAVIVYIFGGIFKRQSNLDNGPEYMMDRRIIIVMPNYRLGVLGFMTTGDKVISGNMGLKDQVLAMQWVQENIYAFGGDPNLVTLHGHSSGAMCVHLHTLSPLSIGLFRRAIIQSGTENGFMGFFDIDVARSIGREFAQRIGCYRNSSEEILECLLAMDAHTFPQIQEQMYIWDQDPDGAFRPTVEEKNAKSPFLTTIPAKCPHPRHDYEWLIGTTTGEGAGKAAGYLVGGGKLARELDTEYKILFPITTQYLWTSDMKYLNYISTTVRQHYFGDKKIDDETAIPLMNMYTEGRFAQSTIEAIRNFKGTKYVYLYDYWSNYSTQNRRGAYPRLGISHAEELHLMFRQKFSESLLTKRDIEVGKEMITRWINFAYTGNPNVPAPINETMFAHWKPVTSSNINYLRITINGTMEDNYWRSAYKFWRALPTMSKYFKVEVADSGKQK